MHIQPPGGAVGGGGEAAGVGAGQGGEDLPLADELLQEDEGEDAVLEVVAPLTENTTSAPMLVATAQEERRVTASGESWVKT